MSKRPTKQRSGAVDPPTMDVEDSTSETEQSGPQRSYAAVVAMPGSSAAAPRQPPPGPPSPTPGGSGSGPAPAQVGNKKRKREAPRGQQDSESEGEEEEDTVERAADMNRRHKMTAIELAHATSRAASLQNSLAEMQAGLAESTSLNEEFRRREEELRTLHANEQKAMEDRIAKMQEDEAQRVLSAHRAQLQRYVTWRRSAFLISRNSELKC